MGRRKPNPLAVIREWSKDDEDPRFVRYRPGKVDVSATDSLPRDKAPRDLSVRVGMRRPRTAVQAALLDQFGLEPGISRPSGFLPFKTSDLSGRDEWIMPQLGYDLLRAIAAPEVARSGDYPDLPFDMQEEAANLVGNFTGAGVASRLAVKPVGGMVLGMAGGPRRLAVKAAPESPLHEITMDYGRDIARRVRDYIDPDAPLSEYRDMAERFAAAANSNFAARPEPSFSVRPAQVATDPRIESRKGELPKIQSLEMELQPRVMDPIPEVSIFDMEGKPYITSMADLAAAGDDIISINGVKFRVPFSRRGGQDYMFDNPGSVWASEKGVAGRHVALANRLFKEYGEHPIYLPWTMGPKAVQFSHQPRGIQYSFIDAALGAKERGGLGDQIRAILPDWRDFEDPESADMFMSATGKARTALNKLMDRYRTQGGLGLGEATYAATDLSQIGAPLMTLRNVGVIDPRFAASPSSHPSYSFHVPGYGLGRLKEPDIGALALDPDLMARLGYKSPFDYPIGVAPGVENPRRAYELKPKGGLITEDTLRLIQRLREEGIIGSE